MTHASTNTSAALKTQHTDLTRQPYIQSRALLSDEFIAQFEGREPNWGPFGKITYLRSYSQYLPHLMRYERWHETVRRVVEFSFALYQGPASKDKLRKEAEELFALVWNLKGFPAGRTLWVGGTPASYTYASAAQQFNCCFTEITKLSDFSEMVLLLMGGSGVGFRVTQDNVQLMNQNVPFSTASLYPDVVIGNAVYVGIPGLQENTTVQYEWLPGRLTRNMVYSACITVGDSREGWAQFAEMYLRELVMNPNSVSQIVVHTNYLRPQGTPLQTFGGHASGPQPLIDFVMDAHRVLQGELDGKGFTWTDLKMLDIANMIGRMVVAGGTRRSAQIALGNSPEFAAAKTGDWWSKAPWRVQSNNSVIFEDSQPPSTDTLRDYFAQIMQFGEPGFINGHAASQRRPEFRGTNPCARFWRK